MSDDTATVRCVGGIVHDAAGRLLLIKRGNPPSAGSWSLPGGRVEHAESDAHAVVRELWEETGLEVAAHELAGAVTRGVYEILDYRCTIRGGSLRPGDDAADTRWVDAAELRSLERDGALTEGLGEALREWGQLPR